MPRENHNDPGKGLSALFYGLCTFWGTTVWDEEESGWMPADYYLPSAGYGRARPGYRTGTFVVILPEPAARQVEIDALTAQGLKFIVLDRDDLDNLRCCADRDEAAALLSEWISHTTHGAVARKDHGLPARGGEGS